ncbi:MAG: hypothetical protein IJT80_10685 [Lachnospiraceae bacterium]|nr:hypothetical protein [Lachnospiraceae bacterium]
MIIFRRQYENAGSGVNVADDELKELLDEAQAMVERAGEGVKSERSPITIVEKVQISDTTALVKKLIIDVNRDIKKGRPADKNKEKLKNAVLALKTSIDNIL